MEAVKYTVKFDYIHIGHNHISAELFSILITISNKEFAENVS